MTSLILSTSFTFPSASKSVVSLLYIKVSAVITISLFLVVTMPLLLPLYIVLFSIISKSVTLKMNSSAIIKLTQQRLSTKVKNTNFILFFINFYYRSKINYC